MLTQIDYNRKEKRYEWIDPESGEILTAPPGAANKRDLFQTAVAMTHPEIHEIATRLIEQNPHAERVIWRAVELATENAVELLAAPRANVIGMVDSSDGYGRYAVQLVDGYHTCQCEHWQSMAAPIIDSGARLCKHVAAVWLVQMTQENY